MMNSPTIGQPVNKSDTAYAAIRRIMELIGLATSNYLEIGKLLCVVRDGKLWQYAGSHITNMDDFFIEIRLGRSTGFNMMAVWEQFGDNMEAGLDIDYTRLVKALPVAKNMDVAGRERLINAAASMPSRAYEDELRELKGQRPSDDCACLEREAWERCKECGKFTKL